MSQTRTDGASSYRTPRWVKAFGVVALILALLVVVMLVTGLDAPHGPSRHVPSGVVGGAMHTAVTEHLRPSDEARAGAPPTGRGVRPI